VSKREKVKGDMNKGSLMGPILLAGLIFLFFYSDALSGFMKGKNETLPSKPASDKKPPSGKKKN